MFTKKKTVSCSGSLILLVCGRLPCSWRAHLHMSCALDPSVLGLMWSWNRIIHTVSRTRAHTHRQTRMFAPCSITQQQQRHQTLFIFPLTSFSQIQSFPPLIFSQFLLPLYRWLSLPFMTNLISRQDRGSGKKKSSLVTTFIISIHSTGDIVIAGGKKKPRCLPGTLQVWTLWKAPFHLFFFFAAAFGVLRMLVPHETMFITVPPREGVKLCVNAEWHRAAF